MRILVTGGHGYIGSTVVLELAASGHEVVVLDTDLYRTSRLRPVAREVAVLSSDIRSVERETLEGFDVVVHLAALSNDPLGELDPSVTREVNSTATEQLARLSNLVGVRRFIFMSSCSVYGASAVDRAQAEDAPVHPITAYAASKLGAEMRLRALKGSMEMIILRGATAFGLSNNPRFDLVINDVVWMAAFEKQITMRSSGSAWRPFFSVNDFARVVRYAIDAPIASRVEVFNVGATENTLKVRDVSMTLANYFDVPMSVRADKVDQRNYRVAFDKLQSWLPTSFRSESVLAGAVELMQMVRTNYEFFSNKDSFVRLRQLR